MNKVMMGGLLALAACGGGETQFWLDAQEQGLYAGVYLMETSSFEALGSFNCTENYSAATCDAVDEDTAVDRWEYTQTAEQSGAVSFVEIGLTSAGPTLMVDGEVIKGVLGEEGAVTFNGVRFDRTENKSDHEAGFSFTSSVDEERVMTMTLTLDSDGILSGTMDMEETTVRKFVESDLWDADETNVFGSYTPNLSSYGLVNEDEEGDGRRNYPEDSDCEDADCVFEYTEKYTYTAPVALTFYGPVEGNFVEYEGYGNGPGVSR